MIKEDSKEWATELATHIVMTSFSVVDSWANELKALKNISFSSQSLTIAKFECATFGHYYLRNMVIGKVVSSDQGVFDRQITDTIIMLLSLGCSSEKNELDHEASVRRSYLTFVEDRHQPYASQVYKENKTVLDYFKSNLRQDFNEFDPKIKFFADTPINKIKRLLVNAISKHESQKWVLLNEIVVYALADDFFSAMKNVDL